MINVFSLCVRVDLQLQMLLERWPRLHAFFTGQPLIPSGACSSCCLHSQLCLYEIHSLHPWLASLYPTVQQVLPNRLPNQERRGFHTCIMGGGREPSCICLGFVYTHTHVCVHTHTHTKTLGMGSSSDFHCKPSLSIF